MRTLKLSSLILLLSPFLQTAQAQIIYRDVNPDPTLQMPASSFGSLLIDVDGDNANDVKLFYTNYQSSGIWNLGFNQLDTNNPTFEVLYNSNLPQSPIGDYYVKPLDLNDNIATTDNYALDYPQIGDIYNSNFRGFPDKYIGFRMKSGATYKYGWMKIDFSGDANMTFVLKELAYQNVENTPIKAGQKFGVGIRHMEFDEKAFSFYPNPVKTTLHIQSEKEYELTSIRIYSIDGKCVKEMDKPDLTLEFDLSALAKGAYFIELIQGENTITRELFLKEE